jgi:diguanylate cyclase (GGDEF)-like protein
MSLHRWSGVLLAVLAVLVFGTWTAVKFTTDHLLYAEATATARDWARYLAESVVDLEQIAAGEQPSTASLAFFNVTRKAGQVFRYAIFNREGYSQLISDRDKIAPVDLSEHNADAANSIAAGGPLVDVRESQTPDLPSFYAVAYVPVMINGQPVAVVAAYVDQTEQRRVFRNTFLLAALSLCTLTGLSFGVPAIAWYRRTREKQQADRRIRYLAQHDALTGLSNRAYLLERLDKALATLPLRNDSLAVHFIDIDRFKEVNDSLGHDGGDFLLKTIAERLLALVRVDDIVARLGGDEFVVVQRGVGGQEHVATLADRIVSALAKPIHYKEQEIVATVSVGIAMAPADGNSPDRLLKSADLALYRSKADGRNCVRFFLPEMDAALLARLKLEKTIRNAVLHNRYELHFQPVFELSGHHLTGFEALVRLPADDGSLIAPKVFIPVAEEIRVIDKIGAWVLNEACRVAATWPDNLTVAVNLSPAQFESGSISELVADALARSGLAPHRLELEITENLLLGNSEAILNDLQRLKAMGVAIVMDDFGTGYSSLSYLWRFPFNKIKIDRSFMQAFDGSEHDAEKVVKTIIALGRELHMQVTVEGVETATQAAFLDQADPDQVQGFFFGRPLPAAEIAAGLLKEFRKTVPSPAAASTRARHASQAGG